MDLPVGRADQRHYHPSPLMDSAAGRGLALYRFVAIGYAAALIAFVHREHVISWWPIIAYGFVIVGWSVVAPLRPRPTRLAIVIELAIAVTGIFLTNIVYEPAEVTAGISTVPGVWAGAPVMAAALLSGVRGGVLAATVIATTNIIQTQHETQLTWHNIILLYLLGGLVGLAVQLATESQRRLERAIAISERSAERDRIGREVHDNVLQALALINRRGRQMGGEGTALADLAADQERSLRSLISRLSSEAHGPPEGGAGRGADGRTGAGPGGHDQEVDLGDLLGRLRRDGVEIILPAGPVRLSEGVASEIRAAVSAALDNVALHAGEGARAWVLVDRTDEAVQVVVRDNGRGMPSDRLVQAAEEGRLGASSSIRGRMLDLGGDATWRTPAGGGTTVTLTAPARRVAGSPS
ncbi:MacS family sensor histidine kinase [Janibacter corallicola]|uniref:MacS family sensor histidine kinase n=1 Tax=Janibacter corallicola TaxID=415212 RepID=UPI000836F7B3|nr:DUF5931 domain-containing protein [Janibacter corallicola]